MTIVSVAADELGIDGVTYIENSNVQQDVQEFIRVVSGVVARIRLRKSSGRDALSVRLASRTKGIIENELAKLRVAVSESYLVDAKKRKLLAKIEDFRTELHKERLTYGVAFSTLAIVAAGLGGTTSFLADAPNAVSTIMSLIGQDKEKEEAEIVRLEGPPPQRLLQDTHTKASAKTSRFPEEGDLPF